jgi:hypothetical protein
MADADSEQVKRITQNIEETYQALRKTARNLSGLLAVNRATCDEIKTYNLYALAVYHTQRGMLTTLRAAGETGVPELPPSPTLFAWKGVSGDQALMVDCSKETKSLEGALALAFASAADPNPKFLGSEQIKILTQDKDVFLPEKDIPSLDDLAKIGASAGLGNNNGLGLPPLVIAIIIAGIVLIVGVGFVAFSKYLQEKRIQEETTERTKIQAKAFESYTAARMACYDQCISAKGSISECQETCKKLIDKPQLDVTPRSGIKPDSGMLEKIGFAVVAVGLAYGGYKLYTRHKESTAEV